MGLSEKLAKHRFTVVKPATAKDPDVTAFKKKELALKQQAERRAARKEEQEILAKMAVEIESPIKTSLASKLQNLKIA
jgi:hypothetical protein